MRSRGLTKGFLGFDLDTRTATIYDDGTVPCQLTVLSDIAQAVKGILLNPASTANRYVYISTFHLNQQQICTAMSAATGGDWKRVRKSTEETRKAGFEKVARGDFGGMEEVLIAAHWRDVEGMDYDG